MIEQSIYSRSWVTLVTKFLAALTNSEKNADNGFVLSLEFKRWCNKDHGTSCCPYKLISNVAQSRPFSQKYTIHKQSVLLIMESWSWMLGALVCVSNITHPSCVSLTDQTGHQLLHQQVYIRNLLLAPRQIPRSVSMENLQDSSADLLSERPRTLEADCLARPLWACCSHQPKRAGFQLAAGLSRPLRISGCNSHVSEGSHALPAGSQRGRSFDFCRR